MYRRFLFPVIAFLLIAIEPTGAQYVTEQGKDSTRRNAILSITLGVQQGFIFAHSPAVENTKGAHPIGIELILSAQRNDPVSWELCNCFPKNGLLLAFYDYDTEILGNSFTAAYFLEPVYKITNRSFFSIRGATGISVLNNPFDSIYNTSNRSYSTKLNGYLLLGIGAWYRMRPHWWLNASLNYQHISNGGMKQPNKGINWPTAGVAISYQPSDANYTSAERSNVKSWINAALRWDLTIFGLARKSTSSSGERTRSAMLGTGIQLARQVGRINNLTAGFEMYKDGSLKSALQRDSISASAVKAGWMIGHEFILGKFLFSQRLGIYVFDQTPYYDLLFHRWGLAYRLNNYAAVGFNLQAHRQVADFIDLRFTYSFTK